MNNSLSRISAGVIALIVWAGLILQFAISIPAYVQTGLTAVGAVVQILSFFTIETNLLVAVVLTCFALVPRSAIGKIFSQPSVLTATGVYICIVGLVYAVALKGLLHLEGLFKVADFLLHTLSPLVYAVFWLSFLSAYKLPWKVMFKWAAFPLTYLVYSLIRGDIVSWYPYPFINAAKLGYGRVAINSLLVLVVFLVFSSLFIGITRLRGQSSSR